MPDDDEDNENEEDGQESAATLKGDTAAAASSDAHPELGTGVAARMSAFLPLRPRPFRIVVRSSKLPSTQGEEPSYGRLAQLL